MITFEKKPNGIECRLNGINLRLLIVDDQIIRV